METSIRESGRKTSQMVKASSGTRMETSMRVSGKMEKLMVKDSIQLIMDQHTWGNGKTIYNMAKVENLGQIQPYLKEII